MKSLVCERRHDCDICKRDGFKVEAEYDAKMYQGPWACMCRVCFKRHGMGLGLGRGQRLIYPVDDE